MTVVIGPDDDLEAGSVEAASLSEVSALAAAGHTVAVTLPADETEAVAAAAVYAWAGATVFRTAQAARSAQAARADAVRQALDMTEAILGRRPPALTRRGLA